MKKLTNKQWSDISRKVGICFVCLAIILLAVHTIMDEGNKLGALYVIYLPMLILLFALDRMVHTEDNKDNNKEQDKKHLISLIGNCVAIGLSVAVVVLRFMDKIDNGDINQFLFLALFSLLIGLSVYEKKVKP